MLNRRRASTRRWRYPPTSTASRGEPGADVALGGQSGQVLDGQQRLTSRSDGEPRPSPLMATRSRRRRALWQPRPSSPRPGAAPKELGGVVTASLVGWSPSRSSIIVSSSAAAGGPLRVRFLSRQSLALRRCAVAAVGWRRPCAVGGRGVRTPAAERWGEPALSLASPRMRPNNPGRSSSMISNSPASDSSTPSRSRATFLASSVVHRWSQPTPSGTFLAAISVRASSSGAEGRPAA